jgi:dCTP deaminase
MIAPYTPTLVRTVEAPLSGPGLSRSVISYGQSSYGYDLRLSSAAFYTFRRLPGEVVDPHNFDKRHLERAELHRPGTGEEYFILPANSYGLGVALEYLELPDDVTALFIGKSTYARCGVIANLTPAEAGWCGHLTLEFSNASSADVKLYAGEGIVQALFFVGERCGVTYADRAGKYQQQGHDVVTARV